LIFYLVPERLEVTGTKLGAYATIPAKKCHWVSASLFKCQSQPNTRSRPSEGHRAGKTKAGILHNTLIV